MRRKFLTTSEVKGGMRETEWNSGVEKGFCGKFEKNKNKGKATWIKKARSWRAINGISWERLWGW